MRRQCHGGRTLINEGAGEGEELEIFHRQGSWDGNEGCCIMRHI